MRTTDKGGLPMERTPGPENPAGHDTTGQLRERLEREYSSRSTVTMTTFVEPKTKAALAAIQPVALAITGRKGFTESAILRVLAELVVELNIDWESALRKVPEHLEPRDAIRWILVRHLPAVAQKEASQGE